MGGIPQMVPMLKPLVAGFGQEMVTMLVEHVDIGASLDVDSVIKEMDTLLSQKLLLLTPEMVKHLMEDVMRKHLGMLVVWGNVAGGCLGVISQAAGYGA